MKDPQVSFIVPVYNVEKYLSVCIESILNQSFSDFELILINDGSKDSSGFICDSYASIDSRVKVCHKENEGVSVARNTGIKEAKGDWILFVDSDDWIDKDYAFHFMNQNPELRKSSLYIQSIQKVEDGFIHEFYSFENKTEELKNEFLENEIHVFGAPYCKLYNKDLIIQNKLAFPENISFGEDTLFYLNYLQYVDNIATLSHKGYYYRQYSSGTLSRKTHPIEQQMFYLITHFDFIQKLIRSKHLDHKKAFDSFSDFYIWGLFIAWISQYKMSKQNIKQNSFVYSNDIKSILRQVNSKSFKNYIVKTIMMNIAFLSNISTIDKVFRIIYK